MRRLTRPGWPGNLLAVVAGAITTLALAPFDLWPFCIWSRSDCSISGCGS